MLLDILITYDYNYTLPIIFLSIAALFLIGYLISIYKAIKNNKGAPSNLHLIIKLAITSILFIGAFILAVFIPNIYVVGENMDKQAHMNYQSLIMSAILTITLIVNMSILLVRKRTRNNEKEKTNL